jgi:hypothetical protein
MPEVLGSWKDPVKTTMTFERGDLEWLDSRAEAAGVSRQNLLRTILQGLQAREKTGVQVFQTKRLDLAM